MYYHLSVDGTLTVLTPKIPECAVSIYENVDTKRVCFADTIEGCLSALQDGPKDYYVYIPMMNLDDKNIYHPTVEDVRDAKYTGEIWVLDEVKVKCIGMIRCENYDWTKDHITIKGKTTFFHYPYKWIKENK